MKKRTATLLTWASVAGVIATAVTTAYATTKAIEIIQEEDEKTEKYLLREDKIRLTKHVYIPPLIVGATTIACILGSNVLNTRHQAALTSAYILADKTCKEYKKKLEGMSEIKEESSKRKFGKGPVLLFYEENYGKFFERTKEEVLFAEYQLNRKLSLKGYVTLKDFYDLLDIRDYDRKCDLGWQIGLGRELYGCPWIDFNHELIRTEDDMDCHIITIFPNPARDYIFL